MLVTLLPYGISVCSVPSNALISIVAVSPNLRPSNLWISIVCCLVRISYALLSSANAKSLSNNNKIEAHKPHSHDDIERDRLPNMSSSWAEKKNSLCVSKVERGAKPNSAVGRKSWTVLF